MTYLLGIDAGLTVTKAVLFDESCEVIGQGSVRVPQSTPAPHWVERDIGELLTATAAAVGAAIADIDSRSIGAIAVTAHGDGLFLLDAEGNPVRPGILSLDSRAHSVLERWREAGAMETIFAATGQIPFDSTPAALLAWMVENEPDVLERARWAMSCKDTIKFWLTGEATTDPTEASTSFTNLHTQQYSDAAFASYGLSDWRELVAPVVGSTEIAGRVTATAAAQTGLKAGTPVVSGMHDVDASAVGSGCVEPGQLSIVAGTYSINQVISDRPHGGERWNARAFVTPQHWLNMAVSPASATNLEWFAAELGAAERQLAEASGGDQFELLSKEVESVLDQPSDVLYLPFLFGSPLGAEPSAGFLGLRGWHSRDHMVKAVFEGVICTHRWHVDDLASAFTVDRVSLAGGASRSPVWAQMFADGLNRRVEVAAAREPGALGVALAAAVGSGIFADLVEATAATVKVQRTYEPDPGRTAAMESVNQRFRAAVDALGEFWAAK